jgi:hypothetical protein
MGFGEGEGRRLRWWYMADDFIDLYETELRNFLQLLQVG